MILTLRHLGAGVAAATLLATVAGCGESRAPAARAQGRLPVVASFYPLAEIARRVGGDRVSVTDLTPPGVEPHDLELSTRDLERILDARVVLYLGRGFQPSVEKAVDRRGGPATDLLRDLPVPPGGSGVDPHVWLDPVLFGELSNRVAAALSAADPAGRAQFEAGAAGVAADVKALDAASRAGLADCDRRLIVTSHAAFGYLARRYGLEQHAVAGVSPEAEPDPRRLAELADLVRSRGVTTVFTETLVSPKVARTLAREAGVGTDVLDPIEGLNAAEQARGDDYFRLMSSNLERLRRALGCR